MTLFHIVKYMVQHALDRGYEIVGVRRKHSVSKLDALKDRITIVPGATNDRDRVGLEPRLWSQVAR